MRITPSPIVLRSRSGYFKRAFSASCFVLNGFDRGVNSPSTYLKSSHCSVFWAMRFYSTERLGKGTRDIGPLKRVPLMVSD
jgi:hypothetical protein